MSLRCHFSKVSGVTTVATCANRFRSSRLAFAARLRVVAEANSPVAELRAKHSVLFAQVLDYVFLLLIHPSGNSYKKKSERV